MREAMIYVINRVIVAFMLYAAVSLFQGGRLAASCLVLAWAIRPDRGPKGGQ